MPSRPNIVQSYTGLTSISTINIVMYYVLRIVKLRLDLGLVNFYDTHTIKVSRITEEKVHRTKITLGLMQTTVGFDITAKQKFRD